MKIQIHNEIKSVTLSKKILTELTRWLVTSIKLPVTTLDIIFTDDENLRKLHEDYLNDVDYTDVMTFNLGTTEAIEGEIYISNERALDNASNFNVDPNNEICRLIVHGCLHLAGYMDNTDENRKKMKKKEEDFLSKISKLFLN
jgi:rRNA maturation RNase YbeY